MGPEITRGHTGICPLKVKALELGETPAHKSQCYLGARARSVPVLGGTRPSQDNWGFWGFGGAETAETRKLNPHDCLKLRLGSVPTRAGNREFRAQVF